MTNFIYIQSLPKAKYKSNHPTGDTYQNTVFINTQHITSVSPTQTSIDLPEVNLSLRAAGSKVTLSNGTIITSDLPPLTLIDQIRRLENGESF